MIEVESTEQFNKEVLDEQGPVVVQFHADWCGPCRALTPRFQAASDRGVGKWVRVNIDRVDGQILNKYRIMSIPRVMRFDNGVMTKEIVGRSADAILKEAELV